MAHITDELGVDITTEDGYILITEPVSIRASILDAIVDALEGITQANGYNVDVNYVSTQFNVEHPDKIDKKDLPACFPLDDIEQKEGFAFFADSTTNKDTKSILTIIVTSVVFDRTGATFDQRTSLMQDIEKAIVMDTTLFDVSNSTGLLTEPAMPVSVETDKGYFENYSIFDQTFACEYVYNHSTGG